MYVFYDIETTGTNIVFDQILQFAAILTDENFDEVERIDLKCKLLPWVVPSPTALLITRTTPTMLFEDTRLSFYEMMSFINERFDRWSPATFVGYNSIRFDEQFLQRAFWQTLFPPYLTVTNGNRRFDILLAARMVAHFRKDALNWPKTSDNKITFKLDRLAPANGFNHLNAHDALCDVEATIFLAKLLATRVPDLWEIVVRRSTKSDVADALASKLPILVFEHMAGVPASWFGRAVGYSPQSSNEVVVAKLDHGWLGVLEPFEHTVDAVLKNSPHAVRRVAINKAPVIFTAEEAKLLFGLTPTQDELAQFEFLGTAPSLTALIKRIMHEANPINRAGEELEQRIFDGFPSNGDKKLCEEFHRAELSGKSRISKKFEDKRLRLLAQRLLYLLDPAVLDQAEVAKMSKAIGERTLRDEEPFPVWRTRASALVEIAKLYADPSFSPADVTAIEKWLERFPAPPEGVSSTLNV